MASASDFTPAGVKAAKASGAWKAKDEFVHIHIDDYKVGGTRFLVGLGLLTGLSRRSAPSVLHAGLLPDSCLPL